MVVKFGVFVKHFPVFGRVFLPGNGNSTSFPSRCWGTSCPVSGPLFRVLLIFSDFLLHFASPSDKMIYDRKTVCVPARAIRRPFHHGLSSPGISIEVLDRCAVSSDMS